MRMKPEEFERLYPKRARKQIIEIAEELHDEVIKRKDPQLKAILETSAVVLQSLAKTFSEYELRTSR